MQWIEIVFRRLSEQQIKDSLQQICEPAGIPDLKHALIEIAANAKRMPIENFAKVCKNKKSFDDTEGTIEVQLRKVNGVEVVQRKFCCAAYNLLSAIITCT